MAHTIGQSHCFKPLRATAIPPKIPPRVSPMIGGAVTTQSFADEIGADGYSADAADAVRLAKKLLAE